MRLTALAGGTGAAKFLRGLTRVTAPSDVTVIGNTGDDLDVWDLAISPDLDTVTYTLAGMVDEAKGWGIRGDTFQCRDAMATLGQATFFSLGDRDLATHLFRSERLRAGLSLSEVTDLLRKQWKVETRILPMTNDRVRTRIETPQGWLAYQEFFVRERCLPEVTDLAYEGADRARPAPGVLEAIADAEAVIVCPSNPMSSVGPILAVPHIRDALSEARGPVIAISPIVGGGPVSGPAGKMMRAKHLDVSVLGVADAYAGFLDLLVIDECDAALSEPLLERGVKSISTRSIMDSREKEIALARAVLEALS